MASYRKLKSGWKVTVSKRVNGELKQISKNGFATKAEARLWGIQAETDDNVGKRKENILFVDYFESWYETYKENKLEKSTAKKYIHVHGVLKKYFPDAHLKDITRTDYQHFINVYGANHAKETVQQIDIAVKACVKSAMLDQYISTDFTARTELVYNRKCEKKVEYLSAGELNRLIQLTKCGLDPRYTSRYMILTAAYTGMRLGEIAALTWNDIDFLHKTISITKSWSYIERDFKQTKTKSSVRTIKVTDELLRPLKQLKENNHSTMVFLNNQHKIPTSNAVNKVLRELLVQADIKRTGYHFHSLRHSHVAYLLYQGIDLYAISKRLGHSSMTITATRYAYLIDELREKEDEKISKVIGRLS